MAVDSGPLYNEEEFHGITCRRCKHLNPIHRVTCERCQAKLPRPEDSPRPKQWTRNRPGYITGWAILFTAYVVLTLLDYGWRVTGSANFAPSDVLVVGVVGVAFMVVLAVVAGVWQMHPWARIPAMLLHVGLIVFIILTMLFAPRADRSTMNDEELAADTQTVVLDVCSGIFWIGFNIMYLVWFAKNKEQFEAPLIVET